MPDQWPRALLRAALREEGYDALGAPGLAAGLRYRPEAPGRGSVRIVLVDQAALAADGAPELLKALARRHADATMVLLARADAPASGVEAPAWRRVLRRPISIAEIVAAVQDLLPLPPGTARPLG
jgi:DNA-binding response OmpR family regulator